MKKSPPRPIWPSSRPRASRKAGGIRACPETAPRRTRPAAAGRLSLAGTAGSAGRLVGVPRPRTRAGVARPCPIAIDTPRRRHASRAASHHSPHFVPLHGGVPMGPDRPGPLTGGGRRG
jgi:hypothetical protein